MFLLKKYTASLLIIVSFCSKAQQNNASVHTIPFELTDYNNISVKATLNNKDTVRLMFHTAANAVAMTEAALAKVKSLHFDKAGSEVKSWGSSNNEARISMDNSLQIGDLSWNKVTIWEDVNSGQNTDGKFGIDLFEGKVIEIDFDERIIRLHDVLPQKTKDYLRFNIESRNDLIFLEAYCKVKDSLYPQKFLIHSGYSGALLFDDDFTAKHGLAQKMEIISEKSLSDSYGNIIKTKKVILPALQLQDITLSQVPGGFFEGAIGRQKMSIMGGDLLKRFNMIIDQSREHMYLQKNKLMDTAYKTI